MKNSFENGDAVELGAVNRAFESDTGTLEIQHRFSSPNFLPTVAAQVGKEELARSTEPPAEDGPQRQQWSNGVEFLMSCIAMSVGLGNVWRFPFTAFENGGGAFLIPYIVVLFLIGKPLYYLELAIGQFVSGGPVKVWTLSPALAGLGYGQVFATALVVTYYCSLMALTIFYFIQSFTAELPWSTCDKDWESYCFNSKKENNTDNVTTYPTDYKSSSELYFTKFLLNEKDHINDGIGDPDWRLTICLLVAWATIFLVIVRGVKSSGKAAYFLALFPYVVMITLLIRGATLPGATDGILYFIRPQWEQLLTPKVWFSAVTQAFFPLGICFGGLIMYSSYNDFHHNVYRDAMIVTTIDTFTSLLAGCTIFSILGNLMYETGRSDIKDVVQGGTGLAFVSYPDAIAKFDVVPQFFSVVFFLMLYTLGIGSAVGLVGTVITLICDQFPKLKYWVVTLVVCTVGFLVGLVYITPGGQFILTLVDFYGANFTVFILGAIEMVGISWIYGLENFCNDLEFMVGRKVSPYWRICWGIITPVLMIVILVYSIASMQPLTYNKSPFPASATGAGWVLFAFGVIQFPIWALIVVLKRKDESLLEMIKSAFKPSELWRPNNSNIYEDWKAFKEARRRELEQISGFESMWQKLLRLFFGYSSLRNRLHESNSVPNIY